MQKRRVFVVTSAGTLRALGKSMTTQTPADKKAFATLAQYCADYAVNRPFGAPEIPSLIVATISGTGREVYNRDGGGTIVLFSSTEVARKAIHTITGVWP